MFDYKNFGVMLDVSRNGVMRVSEVKKFIDHLSLMGYTFLELYSEDVYEIKDEPYYGYLRGAYSADEIKEIDNYAKGKGIELIPCIQTLAHFTNTRKLAKYWDLFDTEDILLIDDEKVYAFLDKLFRTVSENFTSRKINIGMDEAHNVGLGRYLVKHGYHDRYELLLRHLGRVSAIARKYGFRCHMWSDMFFKLLTGGEYNAKSVNGLEIPSFSLAKIPENIDLVYWNYYTDDKSEYDAMFKKHLEFGCDIWFAGGAWAWSGFSPLNAYSLKTMKSAMRSVGENEIKNVFLTVWGDSGRECSPFSTLPALYAVKQYADGNFDDEKIKIGFKETFGFEFDCWMNLDLPNTFKIKGVTYDSWNCLAATMCYTDPFLGLRDNDYGAIDKVPYEEYANTLSACSKAAGEFSYIFDTLSSLCSYLEYKAPLGIVTREVYRKGDKERIKGLLGYYDETVGRLDIFTEKYKYQWLKENKPFGWEIQDIRLGGVRARLLTCRNRLEDYLLGKTDRIEELEKDILPSLHGNGFLWHVYRDIISPSEL